jgi:hypothetical protein
MHKLEIPDISFVTEFPSEIDEMTNVQYCLYVDLVLQFSKGSIDESQFRSKMIQNLLDIRTSVKFGLMNDVRKEECIINIVRLGELMDCFIEEFEQDHQIVKAFKLKSTRNFVPRLLGYYGPKDGFENLSFAEYRVARSFFRQFGESGDEYDLNQLIAILYRPARSFTWIRKRFLSWDGEIRSRFTSSSNPVKIELRAKRISKLPFHLRYCVFLYFAGCEEFLKTGRPVVDGVELDFSQLYTEKAESSDSDRSNVGMVGLLYSMAESGVFGTIEQTDRQNLWDILIRVYQVVMQAKDLERKIKSDGAGT